MTRYRNLSGNSGVQDYEIGEDFIKVKFQDGGIYLYDCESAGRENIERMKDLATAGKGLNTFISKHVKEKYASKLR